MCCRLQPLTGKVTSVSVVVPDTAAAGGGDAGEMGEGRERGESSETDEGGGREYSGGRFAGVGDFEPTVERVAEKRTHLPLFKSKPEAALRLEFPSLSPSILFTTLW